MIVPCERCDAQPLHDKVVERRLKLLRFEDLDDDYFLERTEFVALRRQLPLLIIEPSLEGLIVEVDRVSDSWEMSIERVEDLCLFERSPFGEIHLGF